LWRRNIVIVGVLAGKRFVFSNSQDRAESGTGFYYISQKPKLMGAWILGKARRPQA
jgi:hypothetical protein